MDQIKTSIKSSQLKQLLINFQHASFKRNVYCCLLLMHFTWHRRNQKNTAYFYGQSKSQRVSALYGH